ncbi:MAG: ATP-binding protein [Atopobiaceae bacterium]|jgi:hypothetical protein
MYCPFKTPEGTPKAIQDVQWSDLGQLKELDEGYVLEFKVQDTSSVRRKIPKIIASFANSHGGWLVVGIDDVSKDIRPIPRGSADFSQMVGELVRRHISPAPDFEARFLADPDNDAQSVGIVQVREGDFPPYIADGRVEIRLGSTSGPAGGGELVDLYGKASRRRQEIQSFCRRTIFYPPADTTDELPLFDLYLFKMGTADEQVSSREEVHLHTEAMRQSFEMQRQSCHVQHAHDSLIFRATPFALETAHSAIELFGNESMKLTVPAVPLAGTARRRALQELSQLGQHIPDQSQLVDARLTLKRVTQMASILDRYVRIRGLSWQDFAVAYELEAMAGTVLWSEKDAYRAYVAKHGVLFCGTTDARSRVRYLNDGAHDSFRCRQFAGSHFFEACGLPLGSTDPEDNKLVDALLSSSREARQSQSSRPLPHQ